MRFFVKNITLGFIIVFAFANIYAQEDDYSREKDKQTKLKEEKSTKTKGDGTGKFIFGGGIGLQFGASTYVEVAPKVAYPYNSKGIVGTGIVYRYYRYEDQISHIVLKGSDYGMNVFTSYEIFRNIFGWAEFELLSYDYYYQPNAVTRIWVGSPFLGAGYRQPIGEKGFVQLAFLYNLYYTTKSPYSSPLVTRISFFL
jgi:hypothetical protein